MKWFWILVVLLIILGLGYYGYRKMSHKMMMQSVPTTQPTALPSTRPSQTPSVAPTTSSGSIRY